MNYKQLAEEMDAERGMKEELKQIKKYLTKNWGKKCKDFSCLCGKCIAWRAFETLDELSKIGDYKVVKH